MRNITYKLYGPGGSEVIKKGSLYEIICDMDVCHYDAVPPLKILNDMLKTGIFSSGMSGSCEWNPFEIGIEEYDELINMMTSGKDKQFSVYPCPEWVSNFSDWNIYLLELLHHVPAKEHKILTDEYEKLEAERKKREESGDKEGVFEFHFKACEAGMKLAEFVMKHMNSHHL